MILPVAILILACVVFVVGLAFLKTLREWLDKCAQDNVDLAKGVITFMPTPVEVAFNLFEDQEYSIQEFVPDGDGNPSGDALNEISVTILEGSEFVEVTDNDTTDNITKVHHLAETHGNSYLAQFDAKAGTQAYRALARVTLVEKTSGEPIGGVLVWTAID